MNLKRVDIFQAKTIRGAPKMPTELRYRIEVRLLRRRRQIADRHVLDHAAAKRADLSHRKTSCLKGGAAKNPRSSQTGGNYCDRPLTAAPAASFNQDCVFVLGFESMLLRDPRQNPFSTASVRVGHSSMSPQCPDCSSLVFDGDRIRAIDPAHDV